MSKRVIPFGPDPPRPVLTPRALRIAYAVLIRNERVFLSQLSKWWHTPADPRSQALVFEIVCFLAGLKPAVMVGWGDGTTEDAAAAQNWIKMVWDQWVKSLGRGRGADEDVNLLRDFVEGCKWHRLNSQAGDTAVMTGHYLLYHDPPGPVVKLLVDSGEYDPDHPGRHVEFDEAIYANVFDYPVPLPKEAYWAPAGSEIRTQYVSIGVVYKAEIQLGTQWVAKDTKEHNDLARKQLDRYRERFKDVILDSDLALSFDGKWEFPAGLDRSRLGTPMEIHQRVYDTIEAIYDSDGVAVVDAMSATWNSEEACRYPRYPDLYDASPTGSASPYAGTGGRQIKEL
ncbi:hypothetical protein NliqN6_4179 [Naganishia liquefaciens]|uniref:Uncharacterized protein n=1 Tax=Naganishia liquefaciens TaxID=104408 RepID=A0A8H3YH19_9TREE|nr:hypothetical protein NliqN6_4179 [Naganishia liquefaciens]